MLFWMNKKMKIKIFTDTEYIQSAALELKIDEWLSLNSSKVISTNITSNKYRLVIIFFYRD